MISTLSLTYLQHIIIYLMEHLWTHLDAIFLGQLAQPIFSCTSILPGYLLLQIGTNHWLLLSFSGEIMCFFTFSIPSS